MRIALAVAVGVGFAVGMFVLGAAENGSEAMVYGTVAAVLVAIVNPGLRALGLRRRPRNRRQ